MLITGRLNPFTPTQLVTAIKTVINRLVNNSDIVHSTLNVLIQGENAPDVEIAAQAAVMKAVKSLVNETDAKKVVAKAKFRATSEPDSRDGTVSLLGNKVFSGADAMSVETALSSFDTVSSSSISSVGFIEEYSPLATTVKNIPT